MMDTEQTVCEHGETSGCFDCMVGGSNPTGPVRAKQGHKTHGTQGRATALYVDGLRARGTSPVARPAGGMYDVVDHDHYDERDAWRGDESHERDDDREVGPVAWENSYSAAAIRERESRPDPNLATEKQVRYLWSLLDQRGTEAQRTVDPEALMRWEASRLIDDLLKQPFARTALPTAHVAEASGSRLGTAFAQTAAPSSNPAVSGDSTPARGPAVGSAVRASNALPDVPEGYYAIVEGSETHFYRYDRPTEGKWAGWTFLKVQASDDFYPIKNFGRKRDVLETIAADVNEARMRYATELGRCYLCGRTLTDDDSRALGIGPVCRSL